MMGLLPLSALWAQESYRILEMSRDNRSINLPLPKGRDCSFLLDDDENYEVVRVDSVTLQVRTKAITERSALLIVDCSPETQAYRLSYTNRERYDPSETLYRAGLDRMNSSLALGQTWGDSSFISRYIELADYSYMPFTINLRRSYNDAHRADQYRDSIDVSHNIDDYSLGYGWSADVGDPAKRKDYRLHASAHGYSLSSLIGEERGDVRYQRFALSCRYSERV